jgi:histidyl-tRNA synthetase
MVGESLRLASELRADGIKVETALEEGDKLGKQLKYADLRHIPLAIIVGPDELSRDEVLVKDLRSSTQHSVLRKEVAARVRELL